MSSSLVARSERSPAGTGALRMPGTEPQAHRRWSESVPDAAGAFGTIRAVSGHSPLAITERHLHVRTFSGSRHPRRMALRRSGSATPSGSDCVARRPQPSLGGNGLHRSAGHDAIGSQRPASGTPARSERNSLLRRHRLARDLAPWLLCPRRRLRFLGRARLWPRGDPTRVV